MLCGAGGSESTRLIVLRGNSGSGKSSIAAEIRAWYGRRIAMRRHAMRPQAGDFGRPEMMAWYRERDLLPTGIERVIAAETPLEAAVKYVMGDAGLQTDAL
jgi:hypothetical protein